MEDWSYSSEVTTADKATTCAQEGWSTHPVSIDWDHQAVSHVQQISDVLKKMINHQCKYVSMVIKRMITLPGFK